MRLAAGCLAFVAACTSTDREVHRAERLDEVLRGGYRVAVMPFVVAAAEDGAIVDALCDLGTLLSLESGSPSATPLQRAALALRRALVAALAGGPLQTAELWDSDTRLQHDGFDASVTSDRAQARRIADLLDVDGVLFGQVTDWNRSYAVLQSTQTVGLRVWLVDRRSGETLFTSTRREQVGSGLSGGPTGVVSAATEPIAGLKGSVIDVLARSVARNTAIDLAGAAADVDVEAARGAVPGLPFVSASVEHAGPLRAGDRLTVVAIGGAEGDVRFDIGRYRTGVPMQRVAVHQHPRGVRATWVGTYAVQAGEHVEGAPLRVAFSHREAGHTWRTEREVPRLRIDIVP